MNKKSSARIPALGLRENVPQFVLLVAVNALVGGMVGQQQTVLPLLAGAEFGLSGYTFIFSYVAAFGIAKTVSNWFAGTLADRHGRKPVLLFGWLFAVPVPLMLILAPSWGWIVAANILLGINQGLTWSTTVVMKIDLVGPSQRGLAMGFNESAGYGAVAITSLLAGYLAEQFGLRPAPFLLGVAYTALGLVLTGVFVRETKGHAQLEAEQQRTTHPVGATGVNAQLASRGIAALGSFRDPSLSSASWAGLVNNLNFGLSWGGLPLIIRFCQPQRRSYRPPLRHLPGRLGSGAASHRGTLGSGWTQTPGGLGDDYPRGRARRHRRWTRVRHLGSRGRTAGDRNRDGLSHAAGRCRRRCPPSLERQGRGSLPGLA